MPEKNVLITMFPGDLGGGGGGYIERRGGPDLPSREIEEHIDWEPHCALSVLSFCVISNHSYIIAACPWPVVGVVAALDLGNIGGVRRAWFAVRVCSSCATPTTTRSREPRLTERQAREAPPIALQSPKSTHHHTRRGGGMAHEEQNDHTPKTPTGY